MSTAESRLSLQEADCILIVKELLVRSGPLDCSIDTKPRSIGEDGFTMMIPIELDTHGNPVPASIHAAAMALSYHGVGNQLIFSHLYIPRAAENCGHATLRDKIAARYIQAYDPFANAFIKRMDLLVRVVPPAADSNPPAVEPNL